MSIKTFNAVYIASRDGRKSLNSVNPSLMDQLLLWNQRSAATEHLTFKLIEIETLNAVRLFNCMKQTTNFHWYARILLGCIFYSSWFRKVPGFAPGFCLFGWQPWIHFHRIQFLTLLKTMAEFLQRIVTFLFVSAASVNSFICILSSLLILIINLGW